MRTIVMVAMLTVAVPDRPNPTPKEAPRLPEQILGEWRIDKLTVGGQVTATPANLRITHTDLVIVINGQPSPGDSFTSPYIIDATTTPARIDFTRTKHQGILKMEGADLVLCVRLGGGPRPPDFNTTLPGSTIYQLHLKRVKQ
jgi:uncharacterized protein (TIGR03067 family)